MLFSWDKTAFIELLGVIPIESNDFGGQDEPVFRAVYLGSPGARVVRDKRGHFIELGAPGSFEGRYDSVQPLQNGLRIRVEPHVSVETFGGA